MFPLTNDSNFGIAPGPNYHKIAKSTAKITDASVSLTLHVDRNSQFKISDVKYK